MPSSSPHAAQQQRLRVIEATALLLANTVLKADVGPLGGRQPRQRHVQRKRRPLEMRRQRGRHVAQLRQFFGQEAGRHHAVAPEGSMPP